MALRQAGCLAQRLLSSGALLQAGEGSQMAGSAKVLWNAVAQFGSQAGTEARPKGLTLAASEMAVPQYSAAAAASLAAKASISGVNGSLLKAGKMFSMSRPAARATAQELAVAATPAAGASASGLSKAIKAAAVVAAGLAMAATPALADAPREWQWLFQDSATSTMQAMVDLHHDIFFFLITIVTVTLYMFMQFLSKFHYSRILKPEKLTHHTTMEVIWTVIPTLIVLLIAIPSLTLIYSLDQHTERPGLTVKIIGRQWYWSYEMHDHLQHKLLDADRLVDLAARTLDK